MTEDQYQQEFECSWTANISGSIYGKIIAKMEDDKMVYWVEASKINPVSCTLTGAPLTIAKQLHDDLFSIMRTTILTSATLTVGGGFDYYLEKLGLDRIVKSRLKVESVGSPFDYEDQILVCVPDKFPKPSSQSFQAETSQVILDLVVSTNQKIVNIAPVSYTHLRAHETPEHRGFRGVL